MQTDLSVEAYRIFCNATHQANWETNQPRPETKEVEEMADHKTFEDLAKDANLNDWLVNNCFQIADMWQVNLQKRSRPDFGEFAQAATPVEALRAAMFNMQARDKAQPTKALKPETQKRLDKALLNWLKIMQEIKHAAGREVGEDDL